jgi:hypothetical protein
MEGRTEIDEPYRLCADAIADEIHMQAIGVDWYWHAVRAGGAERFDGSRPGRVFDEDISLRRANSVAVSAIAYCAPDVIRI